MTRISVAFAACGILFFAHQAYAENAYERYQDLPATWYEELVKESYPNCSNSSDMAKSLNGGFGLMLAADSGELRRLLETSEPEELDGIVLQTLELQVEMGLIACNES